ncbi:MAG: LON peptidase substrate-binding domain-containing protein [Polyangiaceae bacterium]
MTTAPGPQLDLDGALGALPLFPLPQAVLFPGAVLPLHVFEPRYKAMIRDCLASHRALAVVQIDETAPRDENGHPGIARVAGAGLVVDYAELSEGRYNILVRGKARVRLDELPFVPPYRTARATLLDPPDAGAPTVPERDLTALISNATAFVAAVRDRDRDFDFRLPKGVPSAALADACAHHLIIDAAERQSVLETLDACERVLRVAEILALQRLALSRNAGSLN